MVDEPNITGQEGTQDATGTTTTPVELPEWLQDESYSELLQDETNKHILSRYKDKDEAVKAVVEKEKMVRSGFKIPKKLSDVQIAELKTHIHRINGVPDKPEGYDMVRPEQVDEAFDFSEQTKMELRAFAKENGIGKTTMQGLYELSLRAMKRAADQAEAAAEERQENDRKTTVALMQKYFGPAEYVKIAGDADAKKVGLIDQFVKSRAADQNEYDQLAEALEKTGLRNNALLFKVLGDASRFYEIMEGSGRMTAPEFSATAGNRTLSREAKLALQFPNTPRSLGGGAPG